jgi:hypothetical protein
LRGAIGRAAFRAKGAGQPAGKARSSLIVQADLTRLEVDALAIPTDQLRVVERR